MVIFYFYTAKNGDHLRPIGRPHNKDPVVSLPSQSVKLEKKFSFKPPR